MSPREAAVAELERRVGYRFQNRELLERALTHSSVGQGAKKVRDNERLEFLGDRVLNLIVAERLMEVSPHATEGELSKLMGQFVNYHACAEVSRAVGLPEALRVDASATKIGARKNDRILGDACEALIAAIYQDGGFAAAKDFVLRAWDERFQHVDEPVKDPKTMLQEWAMANDKPLPDYVVVEQEGPAHAPRFTIEVRVEGLEPERAEAGSKRDAEKLAADRMLRRQTDVPQ
ncbi:ribonuclease III [Phenylobacterium sp.]|jgi:ribonuclease-3|uniref:ribonuclease III n=1 Tax=Phenylobacterium sp. TaxID=1871053 RepID=UPI002F922DA6